MTGVIYNLKTKQVLISIPDVIEVGSDYILGKDASVRGVDLTKAGILVVEQNVKEGEIIDTAKLIDKSNDVKSPLQIALEKIAVLENELTVMKTDIVSLKTISAKE